MKKYFILSLFVFTFYWTSAQNFSNGFNFNLPFDDGTPSVFLPNFPAKALTEADRVGVKGADFIVNNQPYKFWGVNIVAAACFPSKANATKYAARMRKMGINLVRFHHADNPWAGSDGSLFVQGQTTRTLNATTLDRMDYFIAELKKQGIYTNMNLNVSRTFNALDGVVGADSLGEFGKGVTLFDPQLIDLQKEFAKQLLTHKNPYTNTTLADDPSVAMVEMINENSLYGAWKDNDLIPIKNGGILLQRHVSFLDSAWHEFLLKKYTTQAALQSAWSVSGGITPVNKVQNGGFENIGLGTNWTSELHGGAAATFTVDASQRFEGNQCAKIQISNATGTDWHIQFKHVNFSFKKDTAYQIKFSAKASKNRTIALALMRDNAPYTWYGGQSFNLTTDWQTFQFTITPTEDISSVGRLSFNIGLTDGTIWIDNVSMSEPIAIAFNPGEDLTKKNIKRILYSEKLNYTKQRVADLAEFYIGLQKTFMEDMRLYLKNELGVKSPITGTNALVGIQEGLEHENMDYYDDHSYWDHPSFPGTEWNPSNWFINNIPQVKAGNNALINAFSGVSLADKPLTVSEYNHGFPNRYRAEMVHTIAAYGAFHGMDGVMFFDYQSDADNLVGRDFISGFFSIARDPSVMALFPTCAYAFRKGLIAPAKQPVLVNYSRRDVYNSFEKDNNGRWGKYVPYDLKLQMTHSVRTQSYNSTTNFTPSVLPAVASNIFETDTKETVWNTTKGIITTNTPKFAAVTGFLNDAANTTIGNMTLLSGNDFGSLTCLSLNNKNIAEADTLLLTLTGKVQNTSMIWNVNNTTVNNNWGSAPTLNAPQEVKVRFNITADNIILHVLSPTGQSQSKRTIAPLSKNVFDITFSQVSDKTLFYALEIIRTTTGIKEKKNITFLEVFPNPASQKVSIRYELSKSDAQVLQLLDATGKVIFSEKLNPNATGLQETVLNIKDFSAGIYFIKIGSSVKKMLIHQ